MSAWERALQSKKRADFTRSFSALPSSLGGRPATAPTVGPTPANLFRSQSQASQGEGPGLPVGSFTDGRTTTIPKPAIPQFPKMDIGDFFGFSTSPFSLPQAPEYSRVAKPLSADVLQAFGLRRSAVDEAYKTALAQEESGIGRFRASFEAAKQRLDNEASTASSRIARQLAGRGLARSPMVRGRQERELGQVVDDQLGEMKLNLSTEIEGLQQASENARLQRLNLMAQIEQEEALARSQSVDYVRVN